MTPALVTKMNTDRILLLLVSYSGWELQQFNVENAFLYENLEEKVYIEISPSYNATCGAKKVFRLKKKPYMC